MKATHWLGFLLLSAPVVLAGCGGGTSDRPKAAVPARQAEDGAEIKALAGLGPEDRRLAEAQRQCPVSGEPLGSMGTPVKVMVKDQPVFLCCKNCVKKALAAPDRTLAKVRERKASGTSPGE
jgi:hypothetical protein